jgi:hypothetical protein
MPSRSRILDLSFWLRHEFVIRHSCFVISKFVFTSMQRTFYPEVFAREGIELVVPDPRDQDYIHDKYLNELVPGKFLPET